MKNKLSDLNNHLFEQLERLNNDELKGEELTAEIERAKAMSGIATQIINGAKTTIDAMKLIQEGDISKVAQKLIGREDE